MPRTPRKQISSKLWNIFNKDCHGNDPDDDQAALDELLERINSLIPMAKIGTVTNNP